MATFRFRLETLLKMRRDERDVQRQQYAKALEAQRILQDQLAQVLQEIHETQQVLRTSSSPGAVDVDRLLRTHRYELLLQAQQQQLEQQALRVAQEVERRRLNLLQADCEVRLLEKLKERQLEAFQRTEERREQRILDEIRTGPSPYHWDDEHIAGSASFRGDISVAPSQATTAPSPYPSPPSDRSGSLEGEESNDLPAF